MINKLVNQIKRNKPELVILRCNTLHSKEIGKKDNEFDDLRTYICNVSENVTPQKFIYLVNEIERTSNINGILIVQPLPEQINQAILNKVYKQEKNKMVDYM